MPTTLCAPKRFAAKARTPVPVPRSAADQPFFQARVNCSRRRSDIAVVAWSPVPKAAEAGITRTDGFPAPNVFGAGKPSLPALTTTSRFPILSGLRFCPSVNRFSQSRGNFSVHPPNSLTSFRESLRDVHAISSCNCLRFGLEMIASPRREHASKMLLCALSQGGPAIFRHRYNSDLIFCPMLFRPLSQPSFAQDRRRTSRIERYRP